MTDSKKKGWGGKQKEKRENFRKSKKEIDVNKKTKSEQQEKNILDERVIVGQLRLIELRIFNESRKNVTSKRGKRKYDKESWKWKTKQTWQILCR